MDNHSPVSGATYLVLGIVSITLCPVLGPVAVSLSNNALNALNEFEDGGDPGTRGLVKAGFILGVVGTLYLSFIVIALLIHINTVGLPPLNF